jgi:HK97 family phage prohead protease
MPIQSFAFELKSLTQEGTFTGWASTYNNVDHGGDVCIPGCFTKTLQQRGSQIPLLWQHQQPVGLVSLSDSLQGLKAEGKLSMGIQLAKDAYVLLKDGVVKGLSIGYETVRAEPKGGARALLELKLFEVSLVTFQMNEAAFVTSVKSTTTTRDEITRAAAELKAWRESLIKRNPSWIQN